MVNLTRIAHELDSKSKKKNGMCAFLRMFRSSITGGVERPWWRDGVQGGAGVWWWWWWWWWCIGWCAPHSSSAAPKVRLMFVS